MILLEHYFGSFFPFFFRAFKNYIEKIVFFLFWSIRIARKKTVVRKSENVSYKVPQLDIGICYTGT